MTASRIFDALARQRGWRLGRATALVATLALLVGGSVGQAAASPVPHGKSMTGLHRNAAARALAESSAFAAHSHLTTAELVRAARRAGSRLPVHESPRAPRGIPVHPPIVRHGLPVSPARASGGAAQATAAVVLPAARTLPATVSPLAGLMNSPQNQSQTSTTFSLQAQLTGGCGTPCGATTYNAVTFQYRVGTSASFASIPASAVTDGGSAVTWPAATIVMSSGQGVNSPTLTWTVPKTLSSSGLLQIQAQFTDGIGDSYTTSPVTATFDPLGSGGDFAVAPVGPVTVGLQSGDMSLSATDVSINGYGMGLAVSRTFNSLAPASRSIFGPGWTTSFPVPDSSMSWVSVADHTSYAVLTDNSGATYTFAAGTPSGGVTPYTAQGTASAQGLTLTKSSSGFTLTDPSGDQALFTAADVNAPGLFTPLQVSSPGTSRSVGYVYDATQADASYGDPLLMVGPNANLAQGTSSTSACPNPPSAATWANGCRALQFSYNSSGHLTQVTFVYQQSGTLTTTAVAAYGYDASGRLTSEWDPRHSPNLVTGYTYDENSADTNYGRLMAYSPAQSAEGSLAPWTFTYNTTASSADFGKLISVSRAHSGGGTATQTVVYQLPLTTAAGGPVNMDATTVGTWNQTDVPTSGVAIFPGNRVPASPPTAADWPYAQLNYYDADGQQVNTARNDSGLWNVTTSQYDGFGDMISDLTAANRAEALAAGPTSAAVAAELSTVTDYTTSSDGSELTDHVYGPLHNASVPGMGVQEIRDETHLVYDAGAPAGGPFDLVTTQSQKASVGAGIPGTTEADVYTTNYVYNTGTDNTGWTLRSPLQTVTGPNGLQITSTSQYNEDSALYGGEPLVTATCMPSDTACSEAGTLKYIYYTGGANSLDSSCGSHAMWADLVCKTEPAAQPGTPGLPNLPVTTYTYNIYQQLLTKTEAFGSSTRTTTTNYIDRQLPFTTTITTSGPGMGAAVQETKDLYSSTTGLLTNQQTLNSTGQVTGQVQYGYDDFGQLTTYTDGSDNPTTYGYDLAGRVTSRNDGKGTVTIGYDTGGLPTSVADSQAGTFTATRDADGGVASETYPGGLTASYGYDETGTATSLSYAGESWTTPLTDRVVPDTHGNWASQSITDTGQSMNNSQVYTYDKDARLSSSQDTVAGQCTTRTYNYDADSNRTALATAAPGAGGACQTSNPVNTNNTYDMADRVTNTGYAYDTQGDITITPSSDAGGNGNLTATYYANSMLASQSENEQSMTWTLDPTEQRFGSWTSTGVTYTNHYSDTGLIPAWISGSDGSWTRYVNGPSNTLAAEVSASGITLELPDLHGNILAKASASAGSAGPIDIYTYNEFGTPESGDPGTYGWLGGDQISSTALGGQLLMGVRAYSPSTGRFSQVDPVAGGSANAYDYAAQSPLSNLDLTGQWRMHLTWHWWGVIAYLNWDSTLRLASFGFAALTLLAAAVGALTFVVFGVYIEAYGGYILGWANYAAWTNRCVWIKYNWTGFVFPLSAGRDNWWCH